MIVLKYFFKKMDEFGPLMDEREQKEQLPAEQEQLPAEQEQYAFMEEEEEEEEVSTFILKLVKLAHTSYSTVRSIIDVLYFVILQILQTPVMMIHSRGRENIWGFSPSSIGDPGNTRGLTRSLILALSVCYHARLSNREEYEEGVAREFVAPLNLPDGVQQFRNEIRW